MDKKKSLINIFVSIGFKIILLILTIFTKRYLIKYVGNEANGIFTLYTSIIGFLAIAELGIGTAISFSMYKPIVEGDEEKVSALYLLFIRIYRIIGIIITIAGLLILPALPYLANGYTADFNLYYTFLLMLISVVISYMFSAKTSLINAYKNNYITTTFHSIALIIEGVLQIILLYLYRSFELYLLCRIVSVIFEWIVTNIYFNKHHKQIVNKNSKLDSETKKEVLKKTKAMFMHKIGGLLVNTSDSLIISAFIGVILLGKYSNYTMIIVAINGILALFFTPLTSIIGHFCLSDNNEKKIDSFYFFYGVNFLIATVFYLGYYAVIDDVITIFFGPNLELSRTIVFLITLNYYIQFMRQSVLTFRDATGTFYNDRYKPLLEGIVKISLSIPLVMFYGISGLMISTIISTLFICHTIEPYVLFKYGLGTSPKKFYILNYSLLLMFFSFLILTQIVHINFENLWKSFFINGFISVGISILPILIMIIFNKGFKKELVNYLHKISKKIFHRV